MAKEASDQSSTEVEDYDTLFNEFVDKAKSGLGSDEESESEDTDETEESDEAEGEEDPETKDGQPDVESTQLDGWEKRYRDYQSYSDKRYNEIAAQNRELAKKLESIETSTTPQTTKVEVGQKETQEEAEFRVEEYLKTLPEEDREVFEENPALLRVMADLAKKTSKPSGVSESKIAELVQAELAKKEQALEVERTAQETERIRDRVVSTMPNAPEILSDREFLIWRADHTARVEDILGSASDPAEGILNVIRYYKSSVSMGKDNEALKRSTLKGTAGVPKGSPTKTTNKPSEDDYEANFEFYAKQSTRR